MNAVCKIKKKRKKEGERERKREKKEMTYTEESNVLVRSAPLSRSGRNSLSTKTNPHGRLVGFGLAARTVLL
jgi:hypothetical protein